MIFLNRPKFLLPIRLPLKLSISPNEFTIFIYTSKKKKECPDTILLLFLYFLLIPFCFPSYPQHFAQYLSHVRCSRNIYCMIKIKVGLHLYVMLVCGVSSHLASQDPPLLFTSLHPFSSSL